MKLLPYKKHSCPDTSDATNSTQGLDSGGHQQSRALLHFWEVQILYHEVVSVGTGGCSAAQHLLVMTTGRHGSMRAKNALMAHATCAPCCVHLATAGSEGSPH